MDSRPLNGSEIDEVVKIFIENNVLLYHGISDTRAPEGEKENRSYEEKVRYCLNGAEGKGLSCSTISPTDPWIGNTFWPVGLILKPIEILVCSNGDLGYRRDVELSHYLNQYGNPTIKACETAIINRDEMNEFVVSSYQVVGVGANTNNPYQSNQDSCIKLSQEQGLNRIIFFGNGFIDNSSQSVTSENIYGSQ